MTFSDVPKNHPAYEAITHCSERGLVMGYGDGTFKPSEYLTRAQVCIILSRLLGIGGYTAPPIAEPGNPTKLYPSLGRSLPYDNMYDVYSVGGNGVLHFDLTLSEPCKKISGSMYPAQFRVLLTDTDAAPRSKIVIRRSFGRTVPYPTPTTLLPTDVIAESSGGLGGLTAIFPNPEPDVYYLMVMNEDAVSNSFYLRWKCF